MRQRFRCWAQAGLSLNTNELSDAARRLVLEVEKKALNERNAAKERMDLHKQHCPVCARRSKHHITSALT
jgi:hypothetical protein